jgi:hypothetical protein
MKLKNTYIRSFFLFTFYFFSISIFAQTITVTSPNGGETWLPGSTNNIEWTQSGLTADGATNIQLDYSLDNGTTWINIDQVAYVAAATDSYSWTLPNADASTVLVRVTEVGGSAVSDVSDAVFSIHEPKLGIPSLSSPADGASLVPLLATLAWQQNADPSGIFDNDSEYELIISTNQWFSDTVYTNTAITTGGASTSFTLTSALNPNAKYYWKVRAKTTVSSTDFYSPWSAIYVFTTTPVSTAPILTHPINNAIVYTNVPSLYWYTGISSTFQKFELWYGEASTVGTPVNGSPVGSSGAAGGTFIAHTTIGSALTYFVTLESGKNYKWWVRATDGVNVSDWSVAGEFSTSITNGGPVVPVGTYPTSGEYQYTNSPTLYWYIITQVTGLNFQVYVTDVDEATPSGTGTTYSAGSAFFFQVPALTSNTTYYWWVRSTDGTNYSDWSPRYTFRTTESSGSPVKPVLIYPANGETVYFSEVEVSWYAITVALGLTYDLYWSTTNTPPTAATTPKQTGLAATRTTINGLSANTTYYWWVRSSDGVTNSAWSDVGSFVTSQSITQVDVPVLLYPTLGVTVSGTSVPLSWAYYGDTTGIYYEVRYSLYPDMTLSTLMTRNDSTATVDTLTGLSTGTTYYWQVRATNGTSNSAWSSTGQFSTWASSAAPLVVPMTGSPIADVIVKTESPVLSWFLPTNSENLSYELQYSKKGDFSDAITITDISTNQYKIKNIESGKKYYWRVRSKDKNGNVSIYSAVASFVGEKSTDVEDKNIVPKKFEVSQNYPNPFNPSTVIKYALPKAEYVTIKIYNMLGQEIVTLLNAKMDAGTYKVTWNGTDNSGAKVATGSYIYRVVAGNNIVTKKMILLK